MLELFGGFMAACVTLWLTAMNKFVAPAVAAVFRLCRRVLGTDRQLASDPLPTNTL
ncbi:hypothetical protein KBY58_07375 [Cyanobium sp. HWJ4-Hawea]|uniref:hypothetical protein n=1 Tax=Cyanobium sp. HWJ4-Hawea TaxID=2823713 RepID=UPI0020CF3C8D|nr:hypothetical protein [Cyanobium sp. HWJ4-Hawea]MCP9809252.1 hypothetical protein [Cyanobium sp. HWJ4-Hawea]